MSKDGHVEGKCQTMAQDRLSWRLWCFVEEDSGCQDVVEGRSFEACENGE